MQIRRGVFETNSSSTHTITIVGGEYTPDVQSLLYDKNIVVLHGEEFGWGYEIIKDSLRKAEYVYTYIMDCVYDGDLKLLYLQMLKNVLQSVLGENVTIRLSTLGNGYIDHQSADIPQEALTSEETLRDFIFNPKSLLILDSDG